MVSYKTVKGAKYQKRPSAAHFYKNLHKPVGYKISYRPRKVGKYILHSLQLRKNGSAYWKRLEKLPKKTQKKGKMSGGKYLGKTNYKTRKTRKIKKRKQKGVFLQKRQNKSLSNGLVQGGG